MATTTEPVRKILVGGEWYETGETLDVTSPFDGSVVAPVAYGGRADAERAVDAAAKAMEAPLPAHERAAILDPVAGLLRERREELARTISQEAGKPIATASTSMRSTSFATGARSSASRRSRPSPERPEPPPDLVRQLRR